MDKLQHISSRLAFRISFVFILGFVINASSPFLLATSGLIHRVSSPVPGRYLIVFRKVSSPPSDIANDLVRLHGGTIRHVYVAGAFDGASIDAISYAAAFAISTDSRVSDVWEIPTVFPTQVPPGWGLDRIDQRMLPLDGNYVRDCFTGSPVRVYVMDSGINHVSSEFDSRVIDGWSKQSNDGFSDTDNHGTSVASIIGGTNWGAAPGVTLVNVKVLGGGFPNSVDDVISGIAYINSDADQFVGPVIVNMSVIVPGDYQPLDQTILDSVANHNVPYVVGAGNNGRDACTDGTPALLGPNAGVMTIGATMLSPDRGQDLRASYPGGDPGFGNAVWYSNYGSCIDLFAPGGDVDAIDSAGVHRTFTGTSAATPYATGTLARIAQSLWQVSGTRDTPADLEWNLKNAATSGVIDSNTIGPGSPNLLLLEGHFRCR